MTARSATLPRWAVGLFTMLVLAVLAVAGPVGADTRDELDAARERVRELIEEMRQQGELVGTLQAQANAITGRISEVRSRIEHIQAEIVAAQQDIRRASDAIVARQAELDRRAWVAYVYGPGERMEFVLGSTSLADLAERLEIVDRVAATDRTLIDALSAEKLELEDRNRRLEILDRELRGARAELEGEQAELEQGLATAQEAYERLEEMKAEADQLVVELGDRLKREVEAARREAERLAREAAQRASQGGAVNGVLLVCPVDEPHAYSDDFGAPRYTGGYHPHQGNDIFAPYGTPIRAPFPGVAKDASNSIGGLSVKVYGERGYVYNAHLSGFGTLGVVDTGTIIGYVGDSGNAKGTSPHDHFEWHPGNGSAVNPFPFLNAVC